MKHLMKFVAIFTADVRVILNKKFMHQVSFIFLGLIFINFFGRHETITFLVNHYTFSEKSSSSIRFTLQFRSPAISVVLSNWDENACIFMWNAFNKKRDQIWCNKFQQFAAHCNRCQQIITSTSFFRDQKTMRYWNFDF